MEAAGMRRDLSRDERNRLGRLIRSLRIRRDMPTRTELRDRSGISLTTLKALEEGTRLKPREEVLHKLDKALGLPAETLLSYALGDIDEESVLRLVSDEAVDLPAWVRVPRHTVETVDPLSMLVEVLGAASIEQQRRAIAAAYEALREEHPESGGRDT